MIKQIFITILIGFILVLPAAHPNEQLHRSHDIREITLAGEKITALIADTELLRSQGLGGFSGLNDDEIMLFIFNRPGTHAFWMKQMRFAIDIAWVSDDLKIVHIQTHVPPESYPEIFVPPEPALYVIESRAGLLDALRVAVGDKIDIQ